MLLINKRMCLQRGKSYDCLVLSATDGSDLYSDISAITNERNKMDVYDLSSII